MYSVPAKVWAKIYHTGFTFTRLLSLGRYNSTKKGHTHTYTLYEDSGINVHVPGRDCIGLHAVLGVWTEWD